MSNHSKARTDCRYYLAGACKNGSACGFRHVIVFSSGTKAPNDCHGWASTKGCSKEQCKYQHTQELADKYRHTQGHGQGQQKNKQKHKHEQEQEHKQDKKQQQQGTNIPKQQQQQASPSPTQHIQLSQPSVYAVFWDLENLQVAHGDDAFAVALRLRDTISQARPGVREYSFTAYCNTLDQSPTLLQQLAHANVRLTHVPRTGKPNAVDHHMFLDLDRFERSHHDEVVPPTVVLISGDIDFIGKVNDLRFHAHFHVIVVFNQQTKQQLIQCASQAFPWNTFTFTGTGTPTTPKKQAPQSQSHQQSPQKQSQKQKQQHQSSNSHRRDDLDHKHMSPSHADVPQQQQQQQAKALSKTMQGLNISDYPCPACGNSFASAQAQQQHMESQHPQRPQVRNPYLALFACSCGFLFDSGQARQKHEAAHPQPHQQQPQQQKQQKQQKNLQRRRKHQNWECNYCDAEFPKKHSVIQHERDAHGVTQSDESSDEEPEFPCDFCGDGFGSLLALNQHLGAKHAHMFQPQHRHQQQQHVIWKCPDCDAEFPKKHSALQHARDAHGETQTSSDDGDDDNLHYPCRACRAFFGNYQALKKHVESQHTGMLFVHPNPLTRYGCPCCDSSYVSKFEFAQHMNDIHPHIHSFDMVDPPHQQSIEPTYCDTCDLLFLSNVARNKHNQIKHTH